MDSVCNGVSGKLTEKNKKIERMDKTMSEMEWNNNQETKAHKTGSVFGSPVGKIITVAVLYALWLGLLGLMGSMNSQFFTGAIIVISVAIGWKCVTAIQPRMFLFLPIIGWAIYFFVKFFISLFAGLVLTPWQVAKLVFLKA